MARERPAGLPEFDSKPTVRLDQGMPEKDSIIDLSDSAFRLMVEAICYCGRAESDGRIPKGWIKKNASTPGAPRELERHGHIVEVDGQYVLGDYLRWNRAKSEIDSFRASKGESGSKGAHMRWHVPQRKRVAGCAFCYPESDHE